MLGNLFCETIRVINIIAMNIFNFKNICWYDCFTYDILKNQNKSALWIAYTCSIFWVWKKCAKFLVLSFQFKMKQSKSNNIKKIKT